MFIPSKFNSSKLIQTPNSRHRKMLNKTLLCTSFMIIAFIGIANANETHLEDNFVKFEELFERVTTINHLRKEVDTSLTLVEKAIGNSEVSSEIREALKDIIHTYHQLDKSVDAFVPDQELLIELTKKFHNMMRDGNSNKELDQPEKRSDRSDFMKFYHSKFPVIRNGRK